MTTSTKTTTATIRVTGSPVIDAFKREVLEVVGRYRDRGLTFRYPSGEEMMVDSAEQVPVPLHLMGGASSLYASELGRELGVELSPQERGDVWKGVKQLSSGEIVYELDVEVWDTIMLAYHH